LTEYNIKVNEELFDEWNKLLCGLYYKHSFTNIAGVIQNDMTVTQEQCKCWLENTKNIKKEIEENFNIFITNYNTLLKKTIKYIKKCKTV